jgi:WD40 repeat protein
MCLRGLALLPLFLIGLSCQPFEDPSYQRPKDPPPGQTTADPKKPSPERPAPPVDAPPLTVVPGAAPVGKIICLAYDHRSATIVSGDDAKSVWVWDAKTGRPVRPIRIPFRYRLTVSPDGKLVYADGKDDALPIGDIAEGKHVGDLGGPIDSVWCFAWGAGGQLYAGGSSGNIRVWDVGTRKQLRKFNAYPNQVRDMHFLESGELFTAGTRVYEGRTAGGAVTFRCNENDYLKTWDAATGRLRKAHGAAGSQLAFSARRRCVYVLETDGRSVTVEGDPPTTTGRDYVQRDIHSLREIARFESEPVNEFVAAASPDGRLLAVARSGKLRLYDTATDREIFCRPEWNMSSLAFAPNSRQLAGGGAGRLHLLDFPLSEWTSQAGPGGRERLWTKLAGDDMPAAYTALTQLARTPADTLADLDRVVRARAPVAGAEQIRKWIAELDAAAFRDREAAQAQLVKAFAEAEAHLRARLAAKDTSIESRARIEAVFSRVAAIPPLTGDDLHEARYLQLLEMIHSDASLRLVERVAKGAPGHPYTEEAKRVVARWQWSGPS